MLRSRIPENQGGRGLRSRVYQDDRCLGGGSIILILRLSSTDYADYADLIFTLATDTHGPTLTFFSGDNGKGKDMSVCVCVSLWLILHLFVDFADYK